MDNEVMSESSTTRRRKLPAVFRDGVKEMCGDLYKEVLAAKPIGLR